MANGHGGARPGAGRKATTARYPEVAMQVEKRIINSMDKIVDVLIERTIRTGDVTAAKLLLERVLGKHQTEKKKNTRLHPLRNRRLACEDE